MARLWSVRFRDSDEPVEVFAAGKFGAAVNARNKTGKIEEPIEDVYLVEEMNVFTGETIVYDDRADN